MDKCRAGILMKENSGAPYLLVVVVVSINKDEGDKSLPLLARNLQRKANHPRAM